METTLDMKRQKQGEAVMRYGVNLPRFGGAFISV